MLFGYASLGEFGFAVKLRALLEDDTRRLQIAAHCLTHQR